MLYGVTTSFFFNDTATTEIYTLSLHDALPIVFLEAEFLSASEAEGGASQASVSVTIYPDRYLPTVHGIRFFQAPEAAVLAGGAPLVALVNGYHSDRKSVV